MIKDNLNDKDDIIDHELMCEINGESRLDDLIKKRRLLPSERETIKSAIHELIQQEREMEADEDHDEVATANVSYNKWSQIHKYVRFSPFRDRQTATRSEQWRDTLNKLRDLRDKDLIDWLSVNIEVAANIENGIREMRPRKNGPTFLVLLEYVANRKRKALAILHFATEGEKHGVCVINSKWHEQTSRILEKYKLVERDDEGNRIYSNDPLARS